MSTSTQEQRGSGLSSTLVKDFRAILTALEQEKATRADRTPPERLLVSEPVTEPVRPLVTRREPVDKPAPAPYSEVRSRIAALGDVRDMFPSRPAPSEPAHPPAPLSSEAQPVPAQLRPAALRPVTQPLADSSVSEPRRRGFGVVARCAEGEMPARKRRSSSKDAFTWQRLGVLAVFMAIAGGGAVALQSVVGREEAKVAPEAIGNAAIASVAPSAPMAVQPVGDTAVAPSNAPFPIAAQPEPIAAPSVASVVAEVPQPTLRNAEPLFETSPAPANLPGVTAFAPTGDTGADVLPADKPQGAAASTAMTLPRQAPLPPPAPPKPAMVAAATPAAAPVAATASESDAAPTSEDEAPAEGAGFGGAPVGTITLRSPVTMRAAPKKGAAPVGNLSGGQKVELVACSGWCEVIAEGKRGFIYKSFVDVSAVKPLETATP